MTPVSIQSIELKNFRQFLEQTITFNSDGNKNIYVIQGKNGFGKSNIYNAITWCFFDIEEHITDDERSLPMCNVNKFKALNPDQATETYVKIIVNTPNGKISIARKAKIYKKSNHSFYMDDSELQVLEESRDWKIAPYPEYIVNRILPKHMRHFFFIDGEKLRQLFENINPKNIKESIFDLSQINLLKKAADHLESVKRSLRKVIKDEPDLALYEDQMEEIARRIEENKVDRHKYANERDIAYKKIEEIRGVIKGSDYESVKILEAQRGATQKEIDLIEQQLKTKKAEFLSFLLKSAPSVLATDAVGKAIEVVNSMEKAGKLPPKIQETFLEELLQNNECICGADLSKDIDRRKHLEELLENAKYSKIATSSIELRFVLKNAIGEIQDFPITANAYSEDVDEIQEKLECKQKEFKRINDKIGELDIEHIARMHEYRLKFEAGVKELSSKIGIATQQIKNDEKEYKNLDRIYMTLASKKKKHSTALRKVELCATSGRYLDVISEKIMSEVREQIEKSTWDYFNKMISEKSFDNFKIEPDYNLSIEYDGFNAVTSLSAAETLCLGYSFMAGLRQASAFLAPIVIDTPLAKIDAEYRVNVAEWFKKALPNAQVILLVTNTEYTGGFKNSISSNVCQEFLITHNIEAKVSEVSNA